MPKSGMTEISKHIYIVGAGPSGLFAAERLARLGYKVTMFDKKPSPARKFLMAGRGGLNLTHSEPLEKFVTRYRGTSQHMAAAIHSFTPDMFREWCHSLGQKTFIGSSGRVFPETMKASPLLRAWLARLNDLNIKFYLSHDWHGWDSKGHILFGTSSGAVSFDPPDALLLALGGASWPNLGSDGSWAETLGHRNVKTNPFKPANCGFLLPWSDVFLKKYEGSPVKRIKLSCSGNSCYGEMSVTRNGIEGGAVYALSADIRDAVERDGSANVTIDLRPDLSVEDLIDRFAKSKKGRKTLTARLKNISGLSDVQTGLLYEVEKNLLTKNDEEISALIKNLPLRLGAPFPLEKAISSAGGLDFSELNESLMVKKIPGLFVAGEMIDWEAPTGGYLLQGCFAQATLTADGIHAYLSAVNA